MNKRAKRRLALLVVLMILAVLLIVTAIMLSRWNKQRRVAAAKQQGMAAYERGDYAAALNPLSFALVNDREDVDLALALAETRIRNTDETGKYLLGAEKYYNFALTLEPNNKIALNALFDIYVITDQPLKALTVAERLPDDDIQTHKKRSMAQLRLGQTDNALDSITRIRQINPDSQYWPVREYKIRSTALDQSPEEIYDIFSGYVESYPDNAAVELVAIEVLGLGGRKSQALKRMKEASKAENIEAETLMLMIPMMERMGMNEEAGLLKNQTAVLSLTNPNIAKEGIKRLWENSNLNKALEAAQESDRNFIGNADFARIAACIAAMNTNIEWVPGLYIDPWLEKSFQIDSAGAANDRVLAEALESFRSEPSTSGSSIKQSISIFQNNPVVIEILTYLLGKSQESSGDVTSAIRTYEKLDSMSKTYISGITLAIANYRAQNFEQAIDEIESVLRKRATTNALFLYGRMILESDERVIYGLRSKRKNLIRIIEQFIDSKNEVSVPATAVLMPTFTLLAIEDDDQVRVEKALAWSLDQENVPVNVLVDIARMKVGSVEYRTKLLSLIDAKSDNPYEYEMLLLEIEEDDARGLARYEELAEKIKSMKTSDSNHGVMHLRLLRQLPLLDIDPLLIQSEFERILAAIPDNVAASRLVTTYPSIWQINPDLAEVALQNIIRVSGEDSPAAITAKVIKATNADAVDEAERAALILKLDEVIKKSPGSIEALVLMSSMLQRGEQKDLDGAALYLRKAIDLKPDLSSLYPGLIELLRTTGNGALALEYLDDYKNAQILTLRESRTKAGVMAKEGQYKSALDELEELAEKSGEYLDYLSLAQFQASRGLYSEAIESFDRILIEEPGNSIAILGRSMALGVMGRDDEAMSALSEMGEMEPGERLRYMALVNRASGRSEAELRNIEEMLDVSPDNVLNMIVAAETYGNLGLDEERSLALEEILRMDPNNLEVLTILANEIISGKTKSGELDAILESIAQVRPNSARILALIRDTSNMKTGRIEPTEDQVRESSLLADELVNMFDAQRAAWLIHTSKELHEDAYKIALRTFINHPTRVEPIYWATRSALRAGMYQEAIDISEIGMERISNKKKLAYKLEFANLCLQLGYGNRAYTLLRSIREIADDEEALIGAIQSGENQNITPLLIRVTLLRVMLGSSRAREAVELFGPLMSEDPELLNSWIRASRRLTIEDARNALKMISDYVSETSMRIELAEELGVLAKRSKKEVDVQGLRIALSDLRIQLGKDDPDTSLETRLLFVEASLDATQGNIEDAIQKTLKAKSLLEEAGADSSEVRDEDDSETLRRMYYICLNNLASLQLEMVPPQTTKALSNIDRALRNLPDSLKAAAHKTRSEVMLKTGQCDLAIEDMNQAVLLEQAMDTAVEYRIELIELMMDCLYEERAISEAIDLREYIYGSPRPDLDKVRRLDSLIEKGS